jgi:FkbM family methyltransferase
VETVVEAWDRTRYHIGTRSLIEWLVYVQGEYEIDLQRQMAGYLRPGDVYVDCGADVGIHACAMAARVGPSGMVVAIEPMDALADRLEQNGQLNGCDNLVIVRKAASSTPGVRAFLPPGADNANNGQGSFHLAQGHAAPPIRVSTDTLDNILRDVGLTAISVLKIDVEEDEVDVLRGAQATIRKFQPIICFEYNAATYAAAGVSLADAAGLLMQGQGYRLRPLRANDPNFQMVIALPPGQSW